MSVNNIGSNVQMKGGLSTRDVAALLENPASEQRAVTSRQIASAVDGNQLSAQEMQIALEILRTLAADTEVLVRRAVADAMRTSRNLPHDVALRLGRDEASVAVPFLEVTPVLADDDLISILAQGNGAKQVAIARRPHISAVLADAIVDTGNAVAVTTLVSNRGADVSEPLLRKTLDRFGHFETVKAAMVHREHLPVTIAERLVSLISEKLKLALAARHRLPANVASEIIIDARERATVALLDGSSSSADTRALVQQLHSNGRLMPSLVLRALCNGDMEFVEEAMAEIAGTSAEKASILIHDAGKLGLRALYQRCGFPTAMFPAFRAAVDVLGEEASEENTHSRERFTRRVIERILTQRQELPVEDLDYLLAKLRKLEAA
jgi:uncharacterized protein (DUF2336 family)